METLPRLRRCRTYAWCAGHSSADETEHHAVPVLVSANDGRELRLTLAVYGNARPQVDIEVVLTPGGLPLHVAELCPVALVEAAAALARAVTGGASAPGRQEVAGDLA